MTNSFRTIQAGVPSTPVFLYAPKRTKDKKDILKKGESRRAHLSFVLAPPSRLHTPCRLSLFTEAFSAHLQCRALRGFVFV